MSLIRKSLLLSSCAIIAGCGLSSQQTKKSCSTYEEFVHMHKQSFCVNKKKVNKNKDGHIMKQNLTTFDISKLFPKTEQEVTLYAEWAQKSAHESLKELLNQQAHDRTFSSTVLLFDTIITQYHQIESMFEAYGLVCPEDKLRAACHHAHETLQKAGLDLFSTKPIYQAFLAYEKNRSTGHETLTPEQSYLLQEFISDFKREGLHLDDETFNQAKALKKEICALSLNFEATIAQDNSFLEAEEAELTGLSANFIAQLPRTPENKIKLGCDYPTYFEVMGHCSNGNVRKQLYRLFHKRAYPKNYEILSALINARDALGTILGYKSFADFDLENTMAKTLPRVEDFLENLFERAMPKYDLEFKRLTAELPQSVTLTADGKLAPWDLGYVSKQYKKKHYQLDDREVAEYFPVQKVLDGVFKLYQDFLGLSFTLVKPSWVWHDDVLLIEVRTKDEDTLRGSIYLDLYPRDNKYSHACHAGFVPTVWQTDLRTNITYPSPSVALVVANFPKATHDRLALLKFSDVETFLHEFGHAMHFLLGTTIAGSTAGTAVKLDFVEMPSQMFEEWMYEPAILAQLSGHYKTGALLPAHLIKSIIDLKTFDTGSFVIGQYGLATLSLALFKAGKNKDINALQKEILSKSQRHSSYDEENHFTASFGHLGNYSARYYCYLWSKVFALDLFDQIKQAGVTDPEIGHKLVEKVLSKGGSAHPDELLKNFLSRAPTMDAFFKDMGITR